MLYPDLRRLSLVCPTGMPLPRGTHNHEAGGSNDPPPPPLPPQAAGPAQEAALGQADIVTAILRNLGGGSYEDACRVAARWCGLNSEHQAACDAHQPWTDLTQAVFPHSRAPNPRNHEPAHPRDWFFYLCNRHARVAVLRDLVSRIEVTRRYLGSRHARETASDRLRRLQRQRAAQRSRKSIELFQVGVGSGRVMRAEIDQEQNRLAVATQRMEQYEREGAVTWATFDDPERWVGELATLQAYMRGLYAEPY